MLQTPSSICLHLDILCSLCLREIHQAEHLGWRRGEDRSRLCRGAAIMFARDAAESWGKWCGKESFPGHYMAAIAIVAVTIWFLPGDFFIFFQKRRSPMGNDSG
jgi:hypothetical protein